MKNGMIVVSNDLPCECGALDREFLKTIKPNPCGLGSIAGKNGEYTVLYDKVFGEDVMTIVGSPFCQCDCDCYCFGDEVFVSGKAPYNYQVI